MKPIERLDLKSTEPGIYAFRSSSDTVYILDLDHRRGSLLLRSTGPHSHGVGRWDNAWVPFISVESMEGASIAVVGSRAHWLADPGGARDPNFHWWLSRVVTSIERWSDAELDAFLAERGVTYRPRAGTHRLDDVIDDMLTRYGPVLERLASEDGPSSPNADNSERLRYRDRSQGPSKEDILDTPEDERRHREHRH